MENHTMNSNIGHEAGRLQQAERIIATRRRTERETEAVVLAQFRKLGAVVPNDDDHAEHLKYEFEGDFLCLECES
jgi:hypothetical protein